MMGGGDCMAAGCHQGRTPAAGGGTGKTLQTHQAAGCTRVHSRPNKPCDNLSGPACDAICHLCTCPALPSRSAACTPDALPATLLGPKLAGKRIWEQAINHAVVDWLYGDNETQGCAEVGQPGRAVHSVHCVHVQYLPPSSRS